MSAPVRIDAMNEDDFAAVASIDPDAKLGLDQLRDERARPWSRLWVGREDGEGVVAFAIVWHVADEVHVLNVATRAERRRRGAGRALVDEVVRYGREQRVSRVLLEVRRSNRAAIALYRGAGFRATGIRSRYYPDDEDAVEMALELDPDTGESLPRTDDVQLES